MGNSKIQAIERRFRLDKAAILYILYTTRISERVKSDLISLPHHHLQIYLCYPFYEVDIVHNFQEGNVLQYRRTMTNLIHLFK
jgi:hypothetical protein